MTKWNLHSSDLKRLEKKIDELRSQQLELQDHICALACTVSAQLQLIQELTADLSEMRSQARLHPRALASRIVHLREYLEKIPH